MDEVSRAGNKQLRVPKVGTFLKEPTFGRRGRNSYREGWSFVPGSFFIEKHMDDMQEYKCRGTTPRKEEILIPGFLG